MNQSSPKKKAELVEERGKGADRKNNNDDQYSDDDGYDSLSEGEIVSSR